MEQNTITTLTAEQKNRMVEHFEAFEYEYREDPNTNAKVVFENDIIVIVADRSGHELSEWADEFNVDYNELSEEMHNVAEAKTNRAWSSETPIVFEK